MTTAAPDLWSSIIFDSPAPYEAQEPLSEADQLARRCQLDLALAARGATLRRDSKLAQAWIAGLFPATHPLFDAEAVVRNIVALHVLFSKTSYAERRKELCMASAKEVMDSWIRAGNTDRAWAEAWAVGRPLGDAIAKREAQQDLCKLEDPFALPVDEAAVATKRAALERATNLLAALGDVGHAYRSDSALCSSFVEGTLVHRRQLPDGAWEERPWEAREVAERMQSADQLRRETAFPSILRKALQKFERENGRRANPKEAKQIRSEAREKALNTTKKAASHRTRVGANDLNNRHKPAAAASSRGKFPKGSRRRADQELPLPMPNAHDETATGSGVTQIEPNM